LFVLTALGLAACASPSLFGLNPQSAKTGDVRRPLLSSAGAIENPGFEAGLAHWKQCGKFAAKVSKVAHGGKKSASLGTFAKPEIDGEAGICQSVLVPAGAHLTFWVKSAADVSTSFEWQQARLVSSAGKTLEQLYKTATTTKSWKRFRYDLSTYAGQRVTIEFDVRGNGHRGDYVGQLVDDVALVGTAASPTPSPTPTSSTTATPSAAPTAGITPTSSPAPAATPCAQSQATGQPDDVSVVAYSSVTSAISSGRQVCLSAYVFTSAMFSALDSAARNGAHVTVVLPNEERSSDTSDATRLATDGATIVWDPGSPSYHPLHAKLAVVDGITYLDGRNWDTTDVTITDGDPSDFAAIENALNLNPTSSTNLDTVKSLAIAREDAFINGSSPGAGVTIQFMSESFGSDSNTVSALENAANAGATVQVVVLGSDESGNATEANALNAMKADGVQIRLNPQSGSEKMALISGQSTAWFGSANATTSSSLSYNYIDWGMTVTNASVIASLQSYFTTTWNGSSAF
jgi:hypothetical protein